MCGLNFVYIFCAIFAGREVRQITHTYSFNNYLTNTPQYVHPYYIVIYRGNGIAQRLRRYLFAYYYNIMCVELNIKNNNNNIRIKNNNDRNTGARDM